MSHRWDEPSSPDPSGVQLGAIRAHLRAHPQIKRVWLDYCCMPQGHARTESEQLAFGLMLRTNPNPNPNPKPILTLSLNLTRYEAKYAALSEELGGAKVRG